jgi:hypothetical protein
MSLGKTQKTIKKTYLIIIHMQCIFIANSFTICMK